MSRYTATSALQAATEFGGFDLRAGRGMTDGEVREYFSRENFAAMFGPDDCGECGGYALDECASAVIAAIAKATGKGE